VKTRPAHGSRWRASATQEDLTTLAERVLRHEATAIARAADRLVPEDVERAVDILAGCRGKVVVLGSGKSGIAARKIASTMTSTGTAALFLHAVDALHGDIGIVSADDCAILVSKSGESDELGTALTHLKHRRIPIIAIVAERESSIARQADVALDASVDVEACPLNLAPTASTTVAIALGDALAVLLMTAKNFTAEDFALNHPAGALGKRLTLRVRDLMHSDRENPTVPEAASLMDVLETITRGGLGAANVVDGGGTLRGIITDGDIRRAVQRSGLEGLERLRAVDVMTAMPTVVGAQVLAYDALRVMENRPSQIAVLPVVEDDGRCVGLLRLHDIVQAGLR
jgi:arabinose-5-phosphate isomerase